MRYYVAPMEGITGFVFRNVHHSLFAGAEKYYLPFLSPGGEHKLTPRQLRDITPAHNRGIPAVPQILTKQADDFTWAECCLREMGYEEINLNLGCPSGTVTAKGKGAGFLAHPDELDRFLEAVFTAASGPISVKTRIGVKQPEEFARLLEIYNRYPILELTVHARTRQDFYRLPVHPAAFAQALAHSVNPVCCNGDLITADDCTAFARIYPAAEAVMLGRGVAANPAVLRQAQGGAPPARQELQRYHAALFQGYTAAFDSANAAMQRMKEVWFYLIHLFDGAERSMKRLRKATDAAAFLAVTEEIFETLPLRRAAEGLLPYDRGGPCCDAID